MTGPIILLVLVLVMLFWAVGAYSRLVALQKQVAGTLAQVMAQHERRHDLVPDLVESASAWLKQERDVLEAVVDARNHAISTDAKLAGASFDREGVRRMAAAEDALAGALGRMFGALKASAGFEPNQDMLQLVEELNGTENRIAALRQVYNDSAAHYNASRAQFPVSVIAGLFAFRPAEPLQSDGTSVPRNAAAGHTVFPT
ncbi:MAG TPA: LemA family protein [Noviherbaspirillum sp.]|uniref:LemA family protein n=1 Tax=Noviherbaspirillum sp. TaxID=1926288 RepID=UPI002D6269A6|nr:LemA family protein [Noviherbaspirillum sp.]HYD97488.1 LemA family protein [Noviherbaspirillum sp.]